MDAGGGREMRVGHLGGRSCLGEDDEIGHTSWPGAVDCGGGACGEGQLGPAAGMPVVPGQEAWTWS